ncbi:uncharacterized protein K452DRAFT_88781 [Aplosporella prunicola CBS 121167]|uniref:C2H2-type domain-containing protein n=1 Tax=Aplosporella prunicola CBS 121167 TaxID=1176127 RepID=A0A6A6B301_9PEZI|nr:uncharacterized protein K452DRAFT_88781 [Aplosporella prunicola CBS 121167]KAF2138592.1 hypothetical protein K452DRAFT_88781 [Aplosporella prunicola CBS 121167]
MADQNNTIDHKPSSAPTAAQHQSFLPGPTKPYQPTTPSIIHQSTTTTHRRHTSESSEEASRSFQKALSSRHRPQSSSSTKPPHSYDGSPRDFSIMQRSVSPSETPTKYTKTGRISKAKKGLKVHLCESCGKSYTRAEHLRRHQQNHNGAALQCDWPGCGKTFHRTDLLERHRERHNDPNNEENRRGSVTSHGSSRSYETPMAVASPQPQDIMRTSLPQVSQAAYSVTSTPGMIDAVQSSAASSTKMPFATAPPSYARTSIPMAEDLAAHTGSQFFGDWGWTSPPPEYPEYPPTTSGYGSPGHISSYPDYPYATNPYPACRPRTLSNASFIDPFMQTLPRSPASVTSTQPFYWLDVERDPNMHSIALSDSSGIPSYATSDTSIYAASSDQLHASIMAGHSTPSFRSFDDFDNEEYRVLFPDHPFGTPVIDPIQMNEWLSNYWLRFHPTFSIKHKPTFDPRNESPLCLAAMLAVGAQYSDVAGSKAQSRILHERCLKALAKRENEGVTSDRPCDMQAVFLIEVLSLFCGKRAQTGLSTAFQSMYRSLSAEHNARRTRAFNSPTDWQQWIHTSARTRLLTACFILDSQQQLLLLRNSPIIPIPQDVPAPEPLSTWDAGSWAWNEQINASHNAFAQTETAQQSPDGFESLYELFMQRIRTDEDATVTPTAASGSHRPSISEFLAESKGTTLVRHGIQIAETAPLHALLAVAGETWVFDEKLTAERHAAAKRTLRDWTAGFSSADAPASAALLHALGALRLACAAEDNGHDSATARLAPGLDLILLYAALTLWAFVQSAAEAATPGAPSSSSSSTTTTATTAHAFLASTRTTPATPAEVPALAHALSSISAQNGGLDEWQAGVDAVLGWAVDALGCGGEVHGAAVRVLEGIRRRGWRAVWF